MKKIKPIKPKLGHRIANAVRALKGEPWPVQIMAFTPPRVERCDIQTFACCLTVGLHFDEDAQTALGEVYQEEIAAKLSRDLGRELLQAGAIEIKTTRDDVRMKNTYRAELRVVMPGEAQP